MTAASVPLNAPIPPAPPVTAKDSPRKALTTAATTRATVRINRTARQSSANHRSRSSMLTNFASTSGRSRYGLPDIAPRAHKISAPAASINVRLVRDLPTGYGEARVPWAGQERIHAPWHDPKTRAYLPRGKNEDILGPIARDASLSSIVLWTARSVARPEHGKVAVTDFPQCRLPDRAGLRHMPRAELAACASEAHGCRAQLPRRNQTARRSSRLLRLALALPAGEAHAKRGPGRRIVRAVFRLARCRTL